MNPDDREGKMANVVRNPRAGLEVHDSDIHLSPKQYLKLSLFAGLKKPPTLVKFPGALVVRRYRKGEELFRQGEPGWTAYYILTLDDVLAMQQMRLETTTKQNEKIALQLDINRLREEASRRATSASDESARQAATVHIATLAQGYNPREGLRRILNFSSRPTGVVRNRDQLTVYVPRDGPQTVSYETGRAPLYEGDLFGEMSCLLRSPRSGTVIADRDCYMVEFLRHILDAVHRDPAYRTRANAIYLKRMFELQVRKLSLFADLKKEEFEEVRNSVDLVSFDPGDIICDEFERSDCLYLVRQGLVKIMKNVSHLVSPQDITDWAGFCQGLRQGEGATASPAGKLWALLSPRTQEILRSPGVDRLSPAERFELIYAVNDVLIDRRVAEALEFRPLTEGKAFEGLLSTLPARKQDWSDAQVRQHNRLLLEALCPGGLRQRRKHAGIETILSYASANDHFGEIGLMLNQPRGATCIAFSHPNHEGSVELVKLPAATFWKIVDMSPAIRERVKQEVAKRRKEIVATLARPVWEEANQVQFSDQFAEQGLIQGQRLMLIDLDRCTRCDECVRACVNTHQDGHTRLFLDGPRFGKFLVPTACRACLDPVCMIPCPVASIHRGDNKEMIIEDWCIGCSACADACPYGSIQMHDLGLVPEAARGWRWLPASVRAAQGDWVSPGYRDTAWVAGGTPFHWARYLHEQLRDLLGGQATTSDLLAQPINFRYPLTLKPGLLQPDSRYKLEVVSLGSSVKVWLNGRELELDDKAKRGRHEYTVPPPGTKQPATEFLRPGVNVIASQVMPTCNNGEVLFQLRLDLIKRPTDLPEQVEASVAEEVSEKLVTHRAVVCDLCSTLPDKLPACVHACPHDAAMRVDARTQFPSR
jgi:Fe-S-cluster-containing hydrogenase component 2/CRP-like cAMP-binding protein